MRGDVQLGEHDGTTVLLIRAGAMPDAAACDLILAVKDVQALPLSQSD